MDVDGPTMMIDSNRVPSNGKSRRNWVLSESAKVSLFPVDFSDMMGFVSIDNRLDFSIDLLNSTYLNDTFMYNASNISSTAAEERDEKGSTIEFVLMSLVTVLLGLLILITIIGKAHKTHIKHLCMFFFPWTLIDFSSSPRLSGNVFVIIAVLIEKHLQNSGNYLVASLAVADLLVACLGETQKFRFKIFDSEINSRSLLVSVMPMAGKHLLLM
jgi:7 transmembrane receptor (rhodopsin family)